MADMNPKWLAVAAEMLELASDEFSNHGCNDWDFPDDWTIDERRELVRAIYQDNGDPQNFDPDRLCAMDYQVMRFLARRLKSQAKGA